MTTIHEINKRSLPFWNLGENMYLVNPLDVGATPAHGSPRCEGPEGPQVKTDAPLKIYARRTSSERLRDLIKKGPQLIKNSHLLITFLYIPSGARHTF